ncbi:hypothetical protein SEA_YABOI_90 [Streptomyces phage Yaboi]|jgi:hypothetical protein|nr:hypothetical protein [Streptomyces sp. JV178]YP_009841226.1 hypothetical protein HWB86_gp192 [Streptomyces phage Yaboi]QAY08751.1 hypothetical protein SEA_GENIE2_90 [Streptomyces phage Genie2]UVD39937.1 hypothetical protein SEA_STANIMAL_90 [Streptomyces phage Stanimal]WNM73678.1 hypothetical protein SEA_SOLLERTIA_90 [Streptomyces phage Sollertia]AYB70927.1 hypothetical protein SEA_YABOI_90 [Streptomyces phage Yaboi]
MTTPNEENPLILISRISEFQEIHEFMEDEDLDKALHYVIKLMMKPDVQNPLKAQQLIIQLQAFAAKFAMLATIYSTIKKDRAGTPNNNKKNIYYTAAAELDKVVQSLKYSFKTQV